MSSSGLELPGIPAVYAQFSALTAWRTNPGGALLLCSRLTHEGVAALFASNVAGAASLAIEPDATKAQAALRMGICDFVVNDLGESLRILKNEIRKRQPVSVILVGDREAALREILVRGVQPDVVAFSGPELERRGAWLLQAGVEAAHDAVTWSVAETPQRFLPGLDALAVQALEAQDARRHWILSSPRYLGRPFAAQRYVRMSEREADTFVSAVRAAYLPVTVTVAHGNETLVIAPQAG